MASVFFLQSYSTVDKIENVLDLYYIYEKEGYRNIKF